jgi:hypothetical protein
MKRITSSGRAEIVVVAVGLIMLVPPRGEAARPWPGAVKE